MNLFYTMWLTCFIDSCVVLCKLLETVQTGIHLFVGFLKHNHEWNNKWRDNLGITANMTFGVEPYFIAPTADSTSWLIKKSHFTHKHIFAVHILTLLYLEILNFTITQSPLNCKQNRKHTVVKAVPPNES